MRTAITAPAKLITAAAQLNTAPAQLMITPAQPPVTRVVVYTALFLKSFYSETTEGNLFLQNEYLAHYLVFIST